MIETPNQTPFEKITTASFKFREEIVFSDIPATIPKHTISLDKPNEWNPYLVEAYDFSEVVSHLREKKAIIKELSYERGELGGFRFFEESIPEGSNISPEYIYFFPNGAFRFSEIHSKYPSVGVATMPTEWLLKPFLILPIRAIIDHE